MTWTKSGLATVPPDGYGASALHVVYKNLGKDPHSVTATAWSPVLTPALDLDRDSDVHRAAYKMRLYGVVPQDFVDYGDSDGLAKFDGEYSTDRTLSRWAERYAAHGNKRVGYLEPTDSYTHGNFPGVIVMDKNSPTTVLHETCIFNALWNLNVTYTAIGPGGVETTRSGKFTTVCGECQVLELPDGQGFLMVFQQYLFADTVGGYSPFNSRTQIVGWWSDSKSFGSKNTVGPFLLVDDRHCLPDQGHFRMWVGTPGITAIREEGQAISLYLYYIVERCEAGYRSAAAGSLGDYFTSVQYDAALDDWAAGTPAGQFIPGNACKVIDWSYFREQFIDPEIAAVSKTGQPLDTTDIALWDTRETVDGDLLGMVNFWFATGELNHAGLFVLPFFDLFNSRRVRFKAPNPVSCDLSPSTLCLYTAATIADHTPLTYTPCPPGPASGCWSSSSLGLGSAIALGGGFGAPK